MIETTRCHEVRTLAAIVKHAQGLSAVRKTELEFGDLVVVTTANSTYSIYVLDDGFYSISGGWFDRHGLSPMKTTINGCTWGGSAIMLDLMAACGLHLEFGNQVVTSGIKRIHVLRCKGKYAN
jgi:hypothetical protein